MWLVLGLLAALSATSFLDHGYSAIANADDDDDNDDHTGRDEGDKADDSGSTAAFAGMLQELSLSEHDIYPLADGAPMGGLPVNGDAGLFDELDERVHSSDHFPPAEPPQPVVRIGTDEDDRLTGGAANDTLIGGAGDDTLIGAGGDNLLQADSGNNHMQGGEGHDTLIGGTGNDTLIGGWGDDLLIAGAGDNLLFGGAGNDTLVGAWFDEDGNDISGENTLNGGAGDDILIAGQGDVLHGGEGADQFVLGDWLAGASPATIMDYTPEMDQIALYFDTDRIAAPEVTVTFSDAAPDMAEIRLEGHVIAFVANAQGLEAGDIRLVPLPEAIAAE
jgi:Ca2+-binding RTX toxin-like protein